MIFYFFWCIIYLYVLWSGGFITVTADVTYYAVRQAIDPKDAEYTFNGYYDYSDKKYIIEMYYEGPKANMTAFGLAYPADDEVSDIEKLTSYRAIVDVDESGVVTVGDLNWVKKNFGAKAQ